jgi:hypothetical protein
METMNLRDAWNALDAARQERIGSTAIGYAIGFIAHAAQTDGSFDQLHPLHIAAEQAGFNALIEAVETSDALKASDALPLPDVASIGIRACHACGCTEMAACLGGCSWVAPNLCSACVSAGLDG